MSTELFIDYSNPCFNKYKACIKFKYNDVIFDIYIHQDDIEYYNIELIKIMQKGTFAAEPIDVTAILDSAEISLEQFKLEFCAIQYGMECTRQMLQYKMAYMWDYFGSTDRKYRYLFKILHKEIANKFLTEQGPCSYEIVKIPHDRIYLPASVYKFIKNDYDVNKLCPNFYLLVNCAADQTKGSTEILKKQYDDDLARLKGENTELKHLLEAYKKALSDKEKLEKENSKLEVDFIVSEFELNLSKRDLQKALSDKEKLEKENSKLTVFARSKYDFIYKIALQKAVSDKEKLEKENSAVKLKLSDQKNINLRLEKQLGNQKEKCTIC